MTSCNNKLDEYSICFLFKFDIELTCFLYSITNIYGKLDATTYT